ncbi:MAG: Stp1/IreP family PP2C-type Ser/Thr phosphatase [Zhongshania sp.]|uniref:Stp1/IreP family PP2C-type Ser/Thr phosphatase n=1 Tax=Zhongshania sp. TaxID=1971902 RepID=UPI002635D7BE|nr:Stp1/IreP family PP2C-type Ser/Thr phosphatase [Zhongshania sp.]MDF1693728.1 Stp1/IreP family PP2C-type Ser/Thr phosphatase [Zhongshania sp.]
MDENIEFRVFGVTHIGQVREHNEDAIGIAADHGYMVVADGMGGHNAGEVASSIAVAEVSRHLNIASAPNHEDSIYSPQTLALRDAVLAANREILAAAEHDASRKGMGTTVVAMRFIGQRLAVAHVGDSRLYRFREGFLDQLTTDHTLVQEWVARKLYTEEEARTAKNKNVITRALGLLSELEVDLLEELVRSGDIYLLCSDGLTGMLNDAEITEILSEQGHDPEAATMRLLTMANDAGGKDNISIIVVCVDEVVAGQDDALDDESLEWFD